MDPLNVTAAQAFVCRCCSINGLKPKLKVEPRNYNRYYALYTTTLVSMGIIHLHLIGFEDFETNGPI